jgi:hypothetical protein
MRPEEERGNNQAPELHNDEQVDIDTQAQTVAQEAMNRDRGSPTESTKVPGGELMDDSTQDLVDHMRDMESSGIIDMHAYDGEPNLDDNEDKYGEADKVDPELPSDGS